MLGLGNPELGVLMLALFVVFIMFGFPIAFTLMALGVFFGYFAIGDLVFSLLVQRSYSVMTNDVLISIPLFVFMGYIVERANILDRLFRSLQLAAGPIPASLALAVLSALAMLTAMAGTLYPVPATPYNWLPYIYLVYLLLGLIWFTVTQARQRRAIA